jgi:hypothetical protein
VPPEVEAPSLYIYAFIDEPLDETLEGLDGAPTFCVVESGVAALVSAAPAGRLRPQRTRLAAHQRAVASAAARRTALPASFGLVAESEEALRTLLREEGDALREELDRVRGCVEYGVAIRWSGDAFAFLVERDDELRALRDELASLGDRAPHDLKVRIGRRVERALEAERAAASDAAAAALAPACRELIEEDPGPEEELAKLACLVEKPCSIELDAALESLARRLDERFVIDVKGPFAPHHFVRLELAFAGAGA